MTRDVFPSASVEPIQALSPDDESQPISRRLGTPGSEQQQQQPEIELPVSPNEL